MNYIRTKDGRIIDVSLMKEFETDDDNGNRVFDGYEDEQGNYYPAENIVKQADAIEKLCDEIVYHNYFFNQDKPMLYPNDWDYKELLKRDPRVIIYGAIWTNKGLIYVAKMNEKGELELL